jgi:hypothetical protein
LIFLWGLAPLSQQKKVLRIKNKYYELLNPRELVRY